tara:strand:+ start:16420 stop:17475 length:1056 start_codon:yes stop_codon:yes gene_type:complete
MEKRELEEAVSFILSGICFFELDDKLYKIIPATQEMHQLAEFYVKKQTRNLRFQQMMTRDQAKQRLHDLGIWTNSDDAHLKEAEKELEKYKINLFESRLNSKAVNSLRSRIKGLKVLIEESTETKNSFDSLTIEGFTESSIDQFVLALRIVDVAQDCHVYTHSDVYDSSSKILQEAASAWSSSFSHLFSSLREISRKEPWKSFWNAGGKSGPFDIPTSSLNALQRVIMAYSKMYDNAFQSPDCPPEDVFEDDDMFDGWMLKEQEKMKKSREKKSVDKAIDQKGNEVFVMADTKSDANRIFDINEHNERMRLKNKQAEVKERGQVEDMELSDVKLELRKQMMEELKNSRRGG